MRRVASFLLGGALLFGAAALGLPSGSALASQHHNQKKHGHHHHKHHRHTTQRNKLSY